MYNTKISNSRRADVPLSVSSDYIIYDYERDINVKIAFNSIFRAIRNTLHRKEKKETQMIFYKVMAVPTALYRSENKIG